MKTSDATYLCVVPPELGHVTKLTVVNDRVVAETESGVKMIVPTKAPPRES